MKSFSNSLLKQRHWRDTMPAMGFNPFRPQRNDVVELAMVAATLVVTVALVLWAVLSG